MKITILTLFPEMFVGPFDYSIINRAKEKGLVEIEFINIRDFGIGPHKMVDDASYGGGVGMIMKVDVLHRAIEHAKQNYSSSERSESRSNSSRQARIISRKVVLLSASGKPYKQQKVKQYSKLDHLILICGHYEGVDERIKNYIDEEISIGDYVLTGGEIPAMIVIDSMVRLIKGVLPEGATEEESFSEGLLEYPHYTKPQLYENQAVPDVLLSGNHSKINGWRQEQAVKKTKEVRPDLIKK